MFGLFKRARVYCQNCGTDLTDKGGDIANNGKIYCNGYIGGFIRHIDIDLLVHPEEETIIADYKNPKQVQREIREGTLTHFEKLEKTVSNINQ